MIMCLASGQAINFLVIFVMKRKHARLILIVGVRVTCKNEAKDVIYRVSKNKLKEHKLALCCCGMI